MIRYSISLFCCLVFLLLVGCTESEQVIQFTPATKVPLSADSIAKLRLVFDDPEQCKSCHPIHFEQWAMSMHAYSFKDPVFHALHKIGQERSSNALGQFCVECHSPFATMFNEAPAGFNPKEVSSISAHGVSCVVCHSIDKVTPGNNVPTYHTNRVKYGSIEDPAPNPFHTSQYDKRFITSEVCQPCHEFRNPRGVLVEKTYTEWETSTYPRRRIPCQDCHMEVMTAPAAVNGKERTIHEHHMVGVDVPFEDDFPGREKTIELVAFLLQYSIQMSLDAKNEIPKNEPFDFRVLVENSITGHNIPSGSIFERQMWVEVVATDVQTKDTLFASGLLDPNLDLRNEKSDYVKGGLFPIDSDLHLFNGTAQKHGIATDFFWEAEAVQNRTIAPLSFVYCNYTIPTAKLQNAKQIDLSVRVLFRAFPPYFLRKIGLPHLVNKLIVFPMETTTRRITIQQ
jgi:nitrate/TMAO reductase-like tetraheme cytochrome c subunit